MVLLENFKREDAQYAGCKLPDPQGTLAKEVPPSAASDFTTATAVKRMSGFAEFAINEIFKKSENLDPRNLFFIITSTNVRVPYTVAMTDEVVLESAVRGFHASISCTVLLCVQCGPGT